MSDYIAKIDSALMMTEFIGASRFVPVGVDSHALQGMNAVAAELLDGVAMPEVIWTSENIEDIEFTEVTRLGCPDDRFDDADVWFDQVLVRPLVLSFGNILSAQTAEVTVYSSYRHEDAELTEVVNNLGLGVSFLDLPSIPTTLGPQSGFVATLQISTDGSPTLNDTIDFVFDVDTVSISITGRRIVMFPLRPEAPLVETLEFLTDVLEHADGSEQRIALRKNPRQSFNFKLLLDSADRQYFENLIYDWQSRVLGVPVWTDPTTLTAAATSGQLTVQVEDTTLSDYRVGGLAIVLSDRNTFDALEVASTTATSVTFTSPLNHDYSVGTEMFPLRTAVATGTIQSTRSLVDQIDVSMRLRVTDNDVGDSYADTSSFSSLSDKVLLDDYNYCDGAISESYIRRLREYENETGVLSVSSLWPLSKHASMKGFATHSRTELLAVRKLLHALRGRQTAFYMPTFFREITLTSKLQAGTAVISMENVGFTQFAKSRVPSRAILRVVKTNGTILLRNILSSGEIDADNEQIIVDAAWSADVEVADIERIDYVELVRLDSDRIEIEHRNALGFATVQVPVKAVLE